VESSRPVPDALDPRISFRVRSSHGDTFRNRPEQHPHEPFLVLNMIGAAGWSVVVALVGYFFGAAARAAAVDVRKYEHWIVFGILLAAALVYSIYFLHERKKDRAEHLP